MKIRTGFVSNSSSSSFIIVGEKTLKELPDNLQYAEVEGKARQSLLDYTKRESYDRVFLTEFICDENITKLHDSKNCIDYRDGGHGCPYDEDNYIEIDDNVWLLKEHFDYPERVQEALAAYKIIREAGFHIEEDEYDGKLLMIDEIDDRVYTL